MRTERRRPGTASPIRPLAALAAALAAAAPPPAWAADPPAPCTIAVSADPPRLDAGAPRSVRLRISAPSAPRLSASAGRVGPPRADGPGAWVAEWEAPPAGVPRVAIVGALTGGGCGFAAIPLAGLGDAVVRTRPGAEVAVTIADRTFGPARADRTGTALVPVEVPPGVDAVFHGARRIPLELPRVAHVAILLDGEEAPADRAVEIPAMVFATTPSGRPRPGAAPALSAAVGSVTQLVPAGPGAWRGTWRLPPGPSGEARLLAALPGEPAAGAAVRRPAGPPSRATLVLDRERVVAGAGTTVTAAVELLDAAGNPVDGDVAVEAGAGQASAPERIGPGRYRIGWSIPADHRGRDRSELAVRAGAAEARAGLELAPGEPAVLALVAAAPAVTANGRDEVLFHATVTDAHGNPVDRPPTRARAGAGELGPPARAGPGRFDLAYRPRPAAVAGADEVVVELPPLTARAGLRLRPPTARLALAANAGLAGRPSGWLGAQAGAEASTWRWLGGQEAGLALSASFTRLRDEGSAEAGAGATAFTGEVRTLALLLSAGWRRAAGRTTSVRLTAGAGTARVESLVSTGGGPLLPEAAWVPAAGAAAAAGVRLGPGRAFLEARATWLADPDLPSLQGSPSPLSLSLGYEVDAL
jgi:hypothetical protein